MKKISLYAAVFLIGLAGRPGLQAQTATTSSTEDQVAATEQAYVAWDDPAQAVGPNHRTTFVKTSTGSHQIVELATGMNYWDGSQWSPSDASFTAVSDGYAADKIQDAVHLGSDLYVSGSVSVRTPDGIMLNSTPLAIALYDSASGKFLVIATVTHCAPALVTSNQVVYEDAFDGVCASVLYTITQDTFSQDVIFTGRLNPADYGFPTNTTRIQIMTEFYDAPVPDELVRPLYVEPNEKVRAAMATPDLVDEQLGFGRFVLTTGKAFIAPSATDPNGVTSVVAKEYKTIAGHTYLLESIPYTSIASGLQALPPCGQATGSLNFDNTKGYAGIPKAGVRPAKMPEMKMASATLQPGVTVDYVANIGGTMSGTTVFKGDTTYLVSSAVTCNGATTIEGGAVFKYKSNTSITLNSSLTCKTAMYQPAIFTAVDDDTVGDTMNGVSGSGYTGTISTLGYASPALNMPSGLTFSNFRFRYAKMAIEAATYSSATWTVSHAQFVNCIKGVELVAEGCGCGCGCGGNLGIFYVNNCLMAGVQYPFSGSESGCSPVTHRIYLNNSTIDYGIHLETLGGSGLNATLYVTNSIFANVSTMTSSGVTLAGSVNGFYNNGSTFGGSQFSAGASPFQSVGAGGHYLTSASGFRDVGTTNGVPASLLADLKLRTTYPPLVTADTTLSTAQSLVPQAQRDADTPDLGYHYDPLDYAFGNVYVTNAAVTMSDGVAIATFGTNSSFYGLGFGRGSSLSSIGTPNHPNWIVLYDTVMEGTNGNWRRPTNSVTGELYGATPAPAIYTRFTSWSVPAQDAAQFYAPTNSGPIAFQDSEFHDGQLITLRPTIDLTNCLLERVYTSLASADGSSPYLRNNLFYGGTFNFAPNVTNSFVKDNFFDQTSIPTNTSIYTTYNGGYNGFVTNNNRLLPAGGGDVVLSSSPAYKIGPLGIYYQATNSGLANLGHTTADLVGLYHYTVTTNLVNGQEIKETNSIVDIGYHYVATDAYGNPIDTDGDGLPDYLEDSNGDGIYDAGDLGDWLLGRFNGLSYANGLSVFTPLK